MIVAAAGAMLLALILILIASSPGERRIRLWLQQKLTEQTGMEATIGNFETNIWSRIQFGNITLKSSQNDVADTLLYLHSAKINYSLPDLLFGTTRLKSVAVDSVTLRIPIDSLGHTAIPTFDSGTGDSIQVAGKPAAISIDRISLSRLNLGYADSRVPVKVELFDASAEIRATNIEEYLANLKADSIRIDYDNLTVCATELLVEAAWDGRTLALNSATARFAGLTMQAKGSLSGPDFDQIRFETSLEGNPGTLTAAIRNYLGLPELEVNNLYLNAVAGGSIVDPELELRLSIRDARVNNVAFSSLSIDARYQSDTLAVDSLYLSALHGNFEGHGYILTDGSLQTNFLLDIERTDLAELWSAVYGEISPYSGIVNGDLLVSGSGTAISGWNVRANISASGMRYMESPIPAAEVEISIGNDTARLRISHRDNIINAAVRIRESELDGDFEIDIPRVSSLAGFLNFPSLSGRIRASGTIGGTLDDPSVIASVDGSRIAYMNFPADTLHADIVFQDSMFFINQLEFSGRLESVDSTIGFLGLDSIHGGFRYDCRASGPVNNLAGALNANLIAPGYGDYSADSINIRATLGGPRIALDGLDLFRRKLVLTADGIFDTTSARGSLNLELWTTEGEIAEGDDTLAEGFSRIIPRGRIISRISLLADTVFSCDIQGRGIWVGLAAMIDESVPAIDGDLDFELSFNGPLNNPGGKLSACVNSIVLQDLPVDSIMAVASLKGNRLSLESLDMFAPEWSMMASASAELGRTFDNRLKFDGTCRITGQLSIEDLNLSILQPFLTTVGLISGAASARLAWDGTVEAPNLDGWLKVENGRFQIAEKSAPLELHPLQVSMSDSILIVESDGLIAERIPLKLRGRAGIQRRDSFDISLDVLLPGIGALAATGEVSKDNLDLQISADRFDLSVLKPFLTEFDSLGGILTSNMLVRGQPQSPEIIGSLTISDASLHSTAYLLTVNSGSAGMSFNRQRVEIDSITARVNGGHFNMTGYVSHELGNITDINLDLQASGMSFNKPDLFFLSLEDAKLAYKRQDDHYILNGDLRLGEARLTARFRPQSILPWAKNIESVQREMPEILSRTRLDLRIRESDNLWADNNLARVRMHAELGVIGTPARPNLTGMIEVKEGYLIYLDRRFPVTEGSVHFADPVKFNPDVLLTASTQVSTYQRTEAQKYTISIRAEGPLDQLRVDLYSEPYLDKPDIVALLTLGATRTQLAGKGEDQESGLKNAVVNRAAMLTSRRVSGYISDKVGSMFGFEEFTVEGNLFQFDRSWGPQLVASRHLSGRLELTYSTTVGHLNDQAVRLGYRLMPRLSVVGETDRYGRSGVDLKYGIRFR